MIFLNFCASDVKKFTVRSFTCFSLHGLKTCSRVVKFTLLTTSIIFVKFAQAKFFELVGNLRVFLPALSSKSTLVSCKEMTDIFAVTTRSPYFASFFVISASKSNKNVRETWKKHLNPGREIKLLSLLNLSCLKTKTLSYILNPGKDIFIAGKDQK